MIIEDAKATRTRTAFRQPIADRWRFDAIKNMKDTPLNPNPAKCVDKIPILKEPKGGLNEGDAANMTIDGQNVFETVGHEKEFRRRRLRITKDLLET